MENTMMEMDRESRREFVRKAQAVLRKADRPISREDMLAAMDYAVADRVRAFEKRTDTHNAMLALAIMMCRNILADGPLYEEE